MTDNYRILKQQVFSNGEYSIVPIRFEDRYDIMRWRNEQIYHLRQIQLLTEEVQDKYFKEIISNLFGQEKPSQILFSYLEGDKCIGYGGLVHINWTDKNAEISFIMDTSLEKDNFEFHWTTFLYLIEKVAFENINLHKIFTFAFDLRPKLYLALEKMRYKKEAVLSQHAFFEGKFIDVIIHSKIINSIFLREAVSADTELTYQWASNPIVRAYAFNKDVIEWEIHRKWFSEKIANNNCKYYILKDSNNNIGSIRFDLDGDGNAMISYLIDPEFHSKGYGTIILRLGVEKLKTERDDVKTVYGFVQNQNIVSIKIFEKLGFQNTSNEEDIYKFVKPVKE